MAAFFFVHPKLPLIRRLSSVVLASSPPSRVMATRQRLTLIILQRCFSRIQRRSAKRRHPTHRRPVRCWPKQGRPNRIQPHIRRLLVEVRLKETPRRCTPLRDNSLAGVGVATVPRPAPGVHWTSILHRVDTGSTWVRVPGVLHLAPAFQAFPPSPCV